MTHVPVDHNDPQTTNVGQKSSKILIVTRLGKNTKKSLRFRLNSLKKLKNSAEIVMVVKMSLLDLKYIVENRDKNICR